MRFSFRRWLTNQPLPQVTFFAFHWVKGSPFEEGKRKYERYTFWEQLDNGVQWTPTRKFLLLVPIGLYVFSLAL